jgi:hypothetical protein
MNREGAPPPSVPGLLECRVTLSQSVLPKCHPALSWDPIVVAVHFAVGSARFLSEGPPGCVLTPCQLNLLVVVRKSDCRKFELRASVNRGMAWVDGVKGYCR